jgi:hypothetical protein
MDVLSAAGSYRQSQIGGKFDMRAHSTKPSYVRQDSMRLWGRLETCGGLATRRLRR